MAKDKLGKYIDGRIVALRQREREAATRRVERERAAELRELAEWLVSLDGHPLLMDRPTRGDMQAIVRRAREALGQEGRLNRHHRTEHPDSGDGPEQREGCGR